MYDEAVSDDESIAVSLSSKPPRKAFPSYPTSGAAELARLVRAQLELQGPVGSCNPPPPSPPSPMDDNEDRDEGDETSSHLPLQGRVWVLLAHWKTHWNWNDFFYNLTLDLAPAAWDIITDLLFARALEILDINSAGLSYMFISLPIFWLVAEQVAEIKISKIKMM